MPTNDWGSSSMGIAKQKKSRDRYNVCAGEESRSSRSRSVMCHTENEADVYTCFMQFYTQHLRILIFWFYPRIANKQRQASNWICSKMVVAVVTQWALSRSIIWWHNVHMRVWMYILSTFKWNWTIQNRVSEWVSSWWYDFFVVFTWCCLFSLLAMPFISLILSLTHSIRFPLSLFSLFF